SNAASPSRARSSSTSSGRWATVTCGWYGNSSSSASGPRRQSVASPSVWEMPSTRFTNTTGETGRKVPEPRRWTRYAGHRAATSSRCCSTSPSRDEATSTGGTRVMWVGIVEPWESPLATRNSCSRQPQGSGTARETPMVGTRSSSEPRRAGGGEADALEHVAQRGLGDGRRLDASGLQDVHQRLLVLQQLEGAVAERGHELDHHVGEVLLERAVAAP